MTYSVAVGMGISYFQYTNIDSGRNIFIVGFTMFMGLLIPKWLFTTPETLATGAENGNQAALGRKKILERATFGCLVMDPNDEPENVWEGG